jgi:ketosteroid isomerase-like protein
VLPQKPEEWPSLFERAIDAGDLDAAVALYEPGATFITPRTGEEVVGSDGIRRVLSELVGRKVRMHAQVVRIVTVGDVAVLYTDWHTAAVGPSEESAVPPPRRLKSSAASWTTRGS